MCFSWTYWFPSSDIVERSNLGGAFLSAPDPVSSWRLSEIMNQHEMGLVGKFWDSCRNISVKTAPYHSDFLQKRIASLGKE